MYYTQNDLRISVLCLFVRLNFERDSGRIEEDRLSWICETIRAR